jgi:hypothetical protein
LTTRRSGEEVSAVAQAHREYLNRRERSINERLHRREVELRLIAWCVLGTNECLARNERPPSLRDELA